MDKFTVIKIMNEATLRLKMSKNENYEENKKIKEFLEDEALFFKIKKETALKLLTRIGVNKEMLEETYQKLINPTVYNNLIQKGKINSKDSNLKIKYN